ncbi:MAG: cupin domain-containing protein [Halovenus sp.]
MDLYQTLEPADGEVLDRELVVEDDILVKAFALGPGATLDPHEHAESMNVFHVVEGTVTVIRGDEEEPIDAPGVIKHDRGVSHGARNDSDDVAVVTASLCPMPG